MLQLQTKDRTVTWYMYITDFNGLAQDYSKSIANALGLL